MEKYKAEIIRDFLEWLRNKDYLVSHYQVVEDVSLLTPAFKSIEEWLADYFEVDSRELEREQKKHF